MSKLVIALLLIPALAAATSHQGDRDEDLTAPGGSAGAAATVLLESTRNDKSGGDGKGQGPRAKSSGDQDKSHVRVTGYPLFIFAEGPPRAGAAVATGVKERTRQMIADVKRKIPGARIVTVSPLTSAALAEVWRKTRAAGKQETSLITSSLLVIQARGGESTDGLLLMSANGPEPEPKWRDAIGRLSASIYGGLPKYAGGGKLETILLTGQTGVIDCRAFPGPVFGASPAGAPLDEEGFAFWLRWQQDHRQALFPTSARDWFDSWAITDKITRFHYFFCPTPGPRGYLGNMKKNDDIRGGW